MGCFDLEYACFFMQEADELGGVIGRDELYAGFCRGQLEGDDAGERFGGHGFYHFQRLGTGAHDPLHIGYALFGYAFLTAYDEWK